MWDRGEAPDVWPLMVILRLPLIGEVMNGTLVYDLPSLLCHRARRSIPESKTTGSCGLVEEQQCTFKTCLA